MSDTLERLKAEKGEPLKRNRKGCAFCGAPGEVYTTMQLIEKVHGVRGGTKGVSLKSRTITTCADCGLACFERFVGDPVG